MSTIRDSRFRYGLTAFAGLALALLLPFTAGAFTGNPNAKPGAAPEPIYEITVDYGLKFKCRTAC